MPEADDPRRVAITGLGTVTSDGHDLDSFWRWTSAAPSQAIVTQIDHFDPSPWLGAKEAKRSDQVCHYGVAAAHLAIDDSGLDPASIDPRRGGVVLGSLFGAGRTMEAEILRFDPDDPGRVPPFVGPGCCENMVAAMASQHLGWRGPSKVIVTACASGTHAVSEGADLIRSGRCDAVVAGGAQGRVPQMIVAAFDNLRLLSPTSMVRPFDRRRDGFA
ncbi:MAG: beta-ketoacyl synthase, partial [Acidimicrobiales bacterium]|nr:beta-ketoacyl synthase [Acidimicrobiales bacterium]